MIGAHERASSADACADEPRLLQPGHNCWQVAAAQRLAVLVDGSASGTDAALRVRVRAVRDRLLGEHLGQPPERVAKELARSRSLIRVIESLSGPARGLRPFDGTVQDWLEQIVPDAAVVDPERPVDAQTLLAQLAPAPSELGGARSWLLPAAAVLCAAAAVVLALVL